MIIKLTTKRYIKIHDKNLPGNDGWKVEFELKNAKVEDFVPVWWVDKFDLYERIFQEVTDGNEKKECLSNPVNMHHFYIENENGKYVIKEFEEDIEK